MFRRPKPCIIPRADDMGFLPTLPSLLRSYRAPFIHRDLSWLQFNERVLDEARNSSNPVLERLKFLAITSTNLDEFFMVRVPSLDRSLIARYKALDVKDIHRLRRIRRSITESVVKFSSRQEETLDALVQGLSELGISIVRKNRLVGETLAIGKRIFETQILPALNSPEDFTPQHVLSLENLQVGVIFSGNLWLKIPKSLPSLFLEHRKEVKRLYVFFLDDLLAHFLPESFSMKMSVGFVRLTRDADISIDVEHPDPESIPDAVFSRLGYRERGRPVRLQYSSAIGTDRIEAILKASRIPSQSAFRAPGSVYLQGLWALVNYCATEKLAESALYPPLDSRVPKVFREGDEIFEKIRARDYLLHHPYDSFDAFVNWMRVASRDPGVYSIELTVYRMDALSPVLNYLKEAATSKRVRVLIELRARFDELNNLRLADELKKAGVEVGYGFGRLKLHAKIALVSRKENGELVRYTHLSTGNYNSTTARQYTDLAIITAHPEIGADARLFFDSIWEGKVPSAFKHLVVAPARLSRRLQSLIQHEAQAARRGERARIVAKVNALVDDAIAASLYEASCAGVQIDLIVRGACSIIPGVKGLSENIRVISIVDRFLEHSRIYYFGASKRMYFSSADWMPRNFFSRLEIAFPVLDERIYQYLEKVVIPAYLKDVVKARELTPQGTWRKRTRAGNQLPVRSQVFFRELAVRGYRGTPLE